ncbi:MAG: hypothetical protein Crog4KO_04250 [Crocinitomicaceae bacterium]
MKHLLLLPSIAMLSFCGFSQTQIGNGDFENWEAVSSGDEPENWNSFMTAQGGFSGFADVQVDSSSITRPGSTGTKSARIWTRDAGFNIKANGNLTLGKINMGAAQANSPSNYNFTETGNADHSEAFTDMPDSIVFWVNYTAADNQEEARMKATLHDDYDYRDPEDAAAADHVVATAELNYNPTGGWVRMAVAFDYSGPASSVDYILVTFASNAVPGGGEVNDQVLIDDVELIYNGGSGAGLDEASAFPINVFMNNENNELNFAATGNELGQFEVVDMTGAIVLSGETSPTVAFDAPTGVYMVNVLVGSETKRFKVYHQ